MQTGDAADAAPAGLGRLIRAWRARALLTQEQLAHEAGLSERTIRRLERGDAVERPRSASLRLLATALDLTPAERDLLATAIGNDAGEAPHRPVAAPPSGPSDGTAVPRQLPAPPPLFTGRAAEVADLDGAADTSAVVILAIDGMAGIGKTGLAVHAGHRLAGRYPDGQIFLDLHGFTPGTEPVTADSALERMLRALGVPDRQIPQQLDDRAALLRTVLADRKVLLVLDNAASETQVAPLLPGAPGCLVLVTSRRRLVGMDRTHTLSLDALPPADAVALFSRVAGEHRVRAEAPGHLTEIVGLCAHLPLAVRLAAERLRAHPSWSLGHLVDRLRDQRHRLGELDAGPRGVAMALDLSYQDLPGDVQRVYRLLGLHPGTEADVFAVAALTGTTLRRAEQLVERLLEAHLLQEPVAGRYRFHDLVSAHACAVAGRDEPGPERQAARTRLCEHYARTASAAMDLTYPFERERRPPARPPAGPAPELHDAGTAIAWIDAELATLLAVAQHAAEHGSPAHTLHLSATLHRHLRTRGGYDDAVTLHELALAAARSLDDGPGTVDALTALGHIERLRSRNEQAIERYQQALDLGRSIGHRTAEADALVGLGHVHRLHGRNEKATACFAQARQIAGDVADRHGELDALIGLGWCLRNQDRHEEAVAAFVQAREIAHALGDRIGELGVAISLGWFHCDRGRYEESIREFGRTLELARTVGDPHSRLTAVLGTSCALRLQGRHADAAESYGRARALAIEGGDRNSLFEVLQGLGRLHHATGEPDEALAYHQQALDLADDLGQLADQARAHDGLAHAHLALDRSEHARHHWSRALDILTGLGTERTEDHEATVPAIRAHLRDLQEQV